MAEKKRLPSAPAGKQKLGLPTIMDRTLAAQHGVDYVRLVVFAIDVDRVREAVEGYSDPRPFGWEVFLVECTLLDRLDPNRRPEQVLLLEDLVLSVLEGAPDALGSQVVFAIWDAIQRGRLPRRLTKAFASWSAQPTELVEELADFWTREGALRAELAKSCLEVTLEPPLAPPTVETLEAMAGPQSSDP